MPSELTLLEREVREVRGELAQRVREIGRLGRELEDKKKEVGLLVYVQKEVQQKEKTIERLRQQLGWGGGGGGGGGGDGKRGGWGGGEGGGDGEGGGEGGRDGRRGGWRDGDGRRGGEKVGAGEGGGDGEGGGGEAGEGEGDGEGGGGGEGGDEEDGETERGEGEERWKKERAHSEAVKRFSVRRKMGNGRDDVDLSTSLDAERPEKQHRFYWTQKSPTRPRILKSSTLPRKSSTPSALLTLAPHAGSNALAVMARGYTAVDGSGKSYFTPFSTTDRRVYSCQLHARSNNVTWLPIPECPHFEFGLAVLDGALTAIGGYREEFRLGDPTNSLLTLTQPSRKWVERLPPMPTKRRLPAVANTKSVLVVAGGRGHKNAILTSVEVMHVETQQWSTAAPLPLPLTHGSATMCKNHIYIAGEERHDPLHTLHICHMYTCAASVAQW